MKVLVKRNAFYGNTRVREGEVLSIADGTPLASWMEAVEVEAEAEEAPAEDEQAPKKRGRKTKE